MTASRRGVRVRDLLALAAAPTFAAMALWSVAFGGGPEAVICSASPASPLDGMTVMYLLMAVFHLSPWLRLTARRRAKPAARQSPLSTRVLPRLTPPH